MEVKTNSAEKNSEKSPSSYKNKYVEYRRLYENSQKFSQNLTQHVENPTSSSLPGSFAENKLRSSQENDPLAESLPLAQPLKPAFVSHPDKSASSFASNLPADDRMLAKVRTFEPLILAAAERYQLPPELIAGVIWQESRANPRAVSHCGARGLMQLMPATAASLGVQNAFDPAQNIDGGARYLRQMFDKFGRLDFAVAAYNAGPGNVAKHGGIPPYRETQDYVPRVLGYANGFKVAQAFAASLPAHAVRA